MLADGEDDDWLYHNGGDVHANWPEDEYPHVPTRRECLEAAVEIKIVGNDRMPHNLWFAVYKYEKALRYLVHYPSV